MKYVASLFLMIILFGCGSSQVEQSIHVRYIRVSPSATEDKPLHVEISYGAINQGMLEFTYSIKNNSDTIVPIPILSFHYIPMIGATDSLARKESPVIQSIDPQKKIALLNAAKDTLLKEKNPYSLNGKSAGTIVKEGVISGIVASVLGQKPEDAEKIRLKNEEEWDDQHKNQLFAIEKLIVFWKKYEQKGERKLTPNNRVMGAVYFQQIPTAKEIELGVSIGDRVYSHRYKQVN